MEQPPFSVRFGYLLWLRHLTDGQAPTYAEIGEAVGRSGVAVSAWRSAPEPPPDYRVHDPLAAFFRLEDARWLIRNEGDPPMPEVWATWWRHRRADLKVVPKGATKQITRADVAAAKKAARKRNA